MLNPHYLMLLSSCNDLHMKTAERIESAFHKIVFCHKKGTCHLRNLDQYWSVIGNGS
jgi:hypothetical protein